MSDVAYIGENQDTTQKSVTIYTSTSTPASSTEALGATVLTAAGHKVGERHRDAEAAVYAHIRALRALGRTHINTVEIAQALNLPLKAVEQIVGKLTRKGVKIVR